MAERITYGQCGDRTVDLDQSKAWGGRQIDRKLVSGCACHDHIAYAPRGAGLLCALFYFSHERDVCGWWIGCANCEYESAYFMLEEYFSTPEGHYLVTRGGDLYGGWVRDLSRPGNLFERPWPVDGTLCHELVRL